MWGGLSIGAVVFCTSSCFERSLWKHCSAMALRHWNKKYCKHCYSFWGLVGWNTLSGTRVQSRPTLCTPTPIREAFPNALLGVEIWVREMWKWLSLSSFETLHLSLTAVSGGCAFTQAGDLCRSSQKKVTRAKESRQPPLPPGGQGFHPPHHPQVSSSRFSSAFSWAAFLFWSPPFCSSAHLLPLQRFPRLLGLLLVCSGWTLLFAFRRARTLSAPFLLFYRAVQTAQSHRMAHVPEDMLWQRRHARTAKSKNPLQEWARTKSLKNSTGRIDAENTDSKLDMGSVVFACASAVTATALSEVNNCLVRNSPYSKAEHIPGQNSSKLLMIALTGLELQLAQLLFFSLRTCLNFAHDPPSKARCVQPTHVETCWLFFLVMCFFPLS